MLRVRCEKLIAKEEVLVARRGGGGTFVVDRELTERLLRHYLKRCNIVHSLALF